MDLFLQAPRRNGFRDQRHSTQLAIASHQRERSLLLGSQAGAGKELSAGGGRIRSSAAIAAALRLCLDRARLGANRAGTYREAIGDYLAAHEAEPALAAPLFGLAEGYRGLGEPEKAATYYRRFAVSSAGDATANFEDICVAKRPSPGGREVVPETCSAW